MINLLPQSEKKIIARYYLWRVGMLTLVFVSILGALSVVLLLPSYAIINVKQEEILSRLRFSEAAGRRGSGEDPVEMLQQTSEKAKVLVLYSQHPGISAMFGVIIDAKGPEVVITDLSWSVEEGKSVIEIAGEATRRSELTAFAARLKDRPEFTRVDLPVSNLARDRDITFSLTVNAPLQSVKNP